MEEGGGSQSDLEEARIRSCNLLCKVFLQQLPLIYSLATFNDLWVGILDIMDKYMHIEGSELLVSGFCFDYSWECMYILA